MLGFEANIFFHETVITASFFSFFELLVIVMDWLKSHIGQPIRIGNKAFSLFFIEVLNVS
jgi:hypothetical protein